MAKSKPASPKLQAARAELARIRNDADHQVQQSMEKVFSAFVGATDHELRRVLQHQCSPIRAAEGEAIDRMAAGLSPAERKQLFAETLDPHLLSSWVDSPAGESFAFGLRPSRR